MEVTLYQYEMCPFCACVREKLDEKGVEYKKVDVPRDPEDQLRKEMREKSGVATVPVARFDDQWIGESQNIINFVEKHW